MENRSSGYLVLGICLIISFLLLGYFIKSGIATFKEYQRFVRVKGLSEREVEANRAIWPITFFVAANDLTELYNELDNKSEIIKKFLLRQGFKDHEITIGLPDIVDKLASGYENLRRLAFRYTATQTVTLCTEDVKGVIKGMKKLLEIGKQGLILTNDRYDQNPHFMFTKLNEIKPIMIEEATKNARQVALKFAKDSESKLGKIKMASQGQFSINDRDENTPYIKKVRVVSTVEYYIID